MQFKPEMEIPVSGTAIQLGQRVILERVKATESSQTIGKASDLLTCPIIFRLYLRVFVVDRWPVGIAELICD